MVEISSLLLQMSAMKCRLLICHLPSTVTNRIITALLLHQGIRREAHRHASGMQRQHACKLHMGPHLPRGFLEWCEASVQLSRNDAHNCGKQTLRGRHVVVIVAFVLACTPLHFFSITARYRRPVNGITSLLKLVPIRFRFACKCAVI